MKKKEYERRHHVQSRRTAALLIFLLAATLVKAQYDNRLLEDVVAQHEKIYVMLDRDAYVTGSSLQYSVFLTDAGLVQANAQSSVLYFELSGAGSEEIIRWRVNIDKGKTSGAYRIPASLPGGVYTLRAYTNWMRNGEPGYVFSTRILLFNISNESANEIITATDAIDYGSLITFYPEGGTVIEDVPCKIGYKLNMGADAPFPVLLSVMENDSTAVLEITPDRMGFGSFVFLPEPGKDYYAELTLEEGEKVKTALPYIEPYGNSLQVEEGKDGLDVTIYNRSRDNSQRQSLHLIAASRGSILVDTVFVTAGGNNRIHIPGNRLNSGILYITLYDSRRFSQGQRLYFVSGFPDAPSVSVGGMRSSYAPGDRIRLELAVNGLNDGDSASLSVSVTEMHPFQDLIGQSGIRTHFLLSSEIRNMPVSGLDLDDLPAGKIQDLLLLVGANDYAWNYSNKTILSECAYGKEANGFILKGSLTFRSTGEPVADASIMISSADSTAPRLAYALTGEEGEFFTLLPRFFDNRDIVLQVADEGINPADLTWSIEEKTIPLPAYQRGNLPLTDAGRQYAEQSRNIHLIGEVFNNGSPADGPGHEEAPEIVFLQPDIAVYPSDYTELVNFKEIADNILPTARFVRRNRQYATEVFNVNSEIWLPSNRILLNGVLFSDLDYIATLGSNDIVKIEIFNTYVLFGKLTLPGLIAIYTRDGTLPEQYLKNNTYIFHNEVIENNSFNPGPETPGSQPESDPFPDFRQTLCWSPDLKMAGSVPLELEFSASQLKGTYLIDIQGVSESGLPLGRRLNFTIE